MNIGDKTASRIPEEKIEMVEEETSQETMEQTFAWIKSFAGSAEALRAIGDANKKEPQARRIQKIVPPSKNANT